MFFCPGRGVLRESTACITYIIRFESSWQADNSCDDVFGRGTDLRNDSLYVLGILGILGMIGMPDT